MEAQAGFDVGHAVREGGGVHAIDYRIPAYIAAIDRLDELPGRFAAYGQTTTSLIQSSPVPPRGLPLPGVRREPRQTRGASAVCGMLLGHVDTV